VRTLVIGLMSAGVGLLSMHATLAQDAQKVGAGERVYNNYCFTCHGENLVSSGQTFDLRRLRADERPRFDNSVLNGKGQMPPWKGVLSDQDIDNVWAYIRANAPVK
jgi:mono/diheme cytochrome c family protein